MSVPYLNRGESIVLTTHRVSLDSAVYDAMLTNERLILMDSINDRIEPKILVFLSVITVKGGRATSGDPAIILTLEEPNNFTGSDKASIIFAQNPGEKRKHERELWVKELIQLVIHAREKEAQKAVAPTSKKTGMQPSVRRWEAPEPVRPHSSVTGTVPPTPEPIVITEEEPDPIEFFLEANVAKAAGETITRTEALQDTVPPESPPVREDVPDHEAPVDTREIRQEPVPATEDVPVEETVAPDPFAGIHILPPQPEPVKEYESHESFTGIVQAAAGSLQARNEDEPAPVPEMPPVPDIQEPAPALVPEIQEPEPAPAREPVVKKTTPLPNIHPVGNSSTVPPPITPGEKRELPGTYTPEIPVPVISPRRDDATPDKRKPGREKQAPPAPKRTPVAVIAAIIVVALITVLGVAFLATIYFQDSPYGNTIVTIVPSNPVTQEPGAVPADTQPTGVRVRVNYPHQFTGTIGNPEFSRQVSGTGTQVFPVLMTKNIVQATIQKQDYSGDMLTVEIYNNSTLLASRSVTAPMGEVSLLIDTTTAAAPGMNTETTLADGKPLLGNGSLIYY